MPSLNLDLDFFDHPKTKRLIGLLGRGAEILPIKLWAYCGKFHSKDGRLTDYTVQEIESIVGWWGEKERMVAALVKCGFLEPDQTGFKIHDWNFYQGHIEAYRQRAKTAAIKRWDKNACSIPSSIAKNGVEHSLLPVPQCTVLPCPDSDPDARARGTFPSLEKVLSVSSMRGFDPKIAEIWWGECHGRGGCDGRGHPIPNWESALRSYCVKWQANNFQRGTVSQPKLEPDHSKGF